MLGKLLKHEWQATARRYGLFYLVLAIMTLCATIIHWIPVDNVIFEMAEVAFLVLYVFSLAGVAFCSVGMAVVRFYKNMVSDEGYLTFTLPVKVEQLVLSKFLVAFLWQIITAVLVIASLLSVFVIGHIEWSVIKGVGSFVLDQSGIMLPWLVVVVVISTAYQILFYYLCIAIGQLFGNQKIAGAVVAYCVLGFAVEIISMVIMLIGFAIVGFSKLDSFILEGSGMGVLYAVSTILTAIIGVVSYFVTCQLLKKKLNLN